MHVQLHIQTVAQ